MTGSMRRLLAPLAASAVLLLATPLAAQTAIDGPRTGSPGQPLTFRLLDGATPLPVDRWEQVLNPDRYRGNDYVTSFTLDMRVADDGTLTATAPAPGRYKIAAWRGTTRFEASVLIRPVTVAPAVRGASFSAFGPLDRPYASGVLALARRAGMTWADIVQTSWIDFDSGDVTVQPYCALCPGAMPVDDLEWLIDEAHRQGLKVVLHPGVWARYSSAPIDLGGSTWGHLPGNIYELEPVLEAAPRLIPDVMRAYAAFLLQAAALAQRHGVEALILGSGSNAPSDPLLWSQADQWNALFPQLRRAFTGQLWLGTVFTCDPGHVYQSLGFWTQVDAIHVASDVSGSSPSCRWPRPAVNDPTAEEMTRHLAETLADPSFRPTSLGATTGLPAMWTDIYTRNIDGMNYLGSSVYLLGDRAVQDNQEIVDYFEALMRTLGQRPGVGLFLWSVGLSRDGTGSGQDPLRQPALVNAIANWWGGDTSSFAPCLAPDPPGLLFEIHFDRRPTCLLERQDEINLGGGWSILRDSQEPQTAVLHGPQSPTGIGFAAFGKPSWADYVITLRLLISSGAQTVAMVQVRVRVDDGFRAYGVHVGQEQVRLFKAVGNDSQLLASSRVPAGIQLGRWYQLRVAVFGPRVTVDLDGQEVLDFTDTANPFLTGSVSLGTYGSDAEPAVDFDDIVTEAPAVSITADRARVGSGDAVTLALEAENPVGAPAADLHVGILLPDTRTVVFLDSGGAIAGTATLADPSGFRRAAEAAPGFVFATPALFHITIPPRGVPPGTYTAIAALVRQGALSGGRIDPGDVLALDVRRITVAPP